MRSHRLLTSSLLLLPLLFSSSGCQGSSVHSPAAAGDQGRHDVTLEGLFAVRWDAAEERLLLTVTETERPLLYVVSLPQGLGSNDVGLDRGQLGAQRLVELRKEGSRLLLVAPNMRWRTSSRDAAVRDGTRRAFAESVLASFTIVEETEDGIVFDASDFCKRDAHGIARALEDADQGSFQLDEERSLILADGLKAFPENVAIEVLQTFTSRRPGREVRTTTPAPDSVTLRVRHAFVALPELANSEYEPRGFHPRSGYFSHSWNDANTPLGSDTVQRVITRHHVTPETPLVYHIDRAAPEPVRTALLEGARFWGPIFDEAVFPGAFRVELLPADADPDDLRWNIVQWVERSTRGWSYGNSVIDPRTGEILKGHVTLGALRVRQDVLLFSGLMTPWENGTQDPVVVEAALARIRQLSAHEIGHTLGLTHNFAASVNERASVMDYPAPRVRLDAAGEIDLSDAYAPGCGAWDLHAIRYGYGIFDDEAAALGDVIAASDAAGLHFASDADARGNDRAHPLANLWDEGSDPIAQLEMELAVRAKALDKLSGAALDPARPRFELERVLVPLYLRHRYQLEAVARQVAGRWYGYPLASEDSGLVAPVAAAEQLRALELLMESLEPSVLALDPGLVARIPPPPPGYARDRETFRATGPLFDPQAAAGAAADITLDLLLDPARCARLIEQHERDEEQPGLRYVLGLLRERWFPGLTLDSRRVLPEEETVRERVVEHLLALCEDARTTGRVRDRVFFALEQIEQRLAASGSRFDLQDQIRRLREDPSGTSVRRSRAPIPPGSPIGTASTGTSPFGCTLHGSFDA